MALRNRELHARNDDNDGNITNKIEIWKIYSPLIVIISAPLVTTLRSSLQLLLTFQV